MKLNLFFVSTNTSIRRRIRLPDAVCRVLP